MPLRIYALITLAFPLDASPDPVHFPAGHEHDTVGFKQRISWRRLIKLVHRPPVITTSAAGQQKE